MARGRTDWWTTCVLAAGMAWSSCASAGEDLGALQARVVAAAARAMPSVVAVETGIPQPKHGHYESYGSGVIVSADGLILSQFHVSHHRDRGDPSASHDAGRRLRVVLHDGRVEEAELLGADPAADVSMLRLLGPGPYPSSPVDAGRLVRPGDGVLKLGHPLGYRAGRAPAVRLGRVVQVDGPLFVCDCQVIGGDSGGPFFDLDGRLVGVINASAISDALANARARLPRTKFLAGVTGNAALAERLEALRAGEIAPVARPAGPRPGAEPEVLPVERWSQGRDALGAWAEVAAGARGSVAAVLDGDSPAALATCVGPGLLLTKASLLPAEPRCRLGDGPSVPAEVLGGDAAWDVALLRVPAEGTTPIAWAKRPDVPLPAGTLLVAAGPSGEPLAVGVVAVPRRDLEGPFPGAIPPPRPAPAARPEAIGSAVKGRGYWVEHVEGRLAEAGVRPGDVLTRIAGVPIRDHDDLAACVRGRRAGQRVPVRLLRGAEALELTLALRADGPSASSGRDDDFPEVFEHDVPLRGDELGGPVLDREGRALGLAIAEGPVGGMAVPGDRLAEVVADLEAGRSPWRGPARAESPPVAAPEPPRPAGATIDEVRERLRERAARIPSLMVDYEATVEADAEPAQLMAWSLVVVRDYRERHLFAYSGARRASRVFVPGGQPRWLPEERVAPDPDSPPDLARSVEANRRASAAREEQGDARRLIAIPAPSDTRFAYDGERCYRWMEQAGRYAPCPPEEFYAPADYLAGLGLRPTDPRPSDSALASQRDFWLAEAAPPGVEARLRAESEAIDDARCVVLERERPDGRADAIWLDPELGWAPRRWEQRAAGRLVVVRSFRDFDEFAPGVFLPWEGSLAVYPPAWVAPALRDRPAYTVRQRLRKARVGDVADALFRP